MILVFDNRDKKLKPYKQFSSCNRMFWCEIPAESSLAARLEFEALGDKIRLNRQGLLNWAQQLQG